MRYKISAIEKIPKLIAEYYISVSDKKTESFKSLNILHPNFSETGIICFSETDFPVKDLHIVCEDEDPTENNKEGFSLNSCANPDEIFDGILDHYGPLGSITDVVSCDVKNLSEEFKLKFIELYNSGELQGFEFDQEDYSVLIEGKMKVDKV